jgi:hypothetical protein
MKTPPDHFNDLGYPKLQQKKTAQKKSFCSVLLPESILIVRVSPWVAGIIQRSPELRPCKGSFA